MCNVDQTSTTSEPHSYKVSRERVSEIASEVRRLVEEQEALISTWVTFFDRSEEDLAVYAQP